MIPRRIVVSLFVALALWSCVANAVYFFVSDSKESCFLQEGKFAVLLTFEIRCPSHASATHTRIPFLRTVPEDTAVQASYANLDRDMLGVGSDGHPTTIHVTVTDPDKQVVLSHEAQRKGVVAWTSSKEGEHVVCVSVQNNNKSGRKFRFGMTFKQGKTEKDYATMAKQEHLSAIIVEIRKLSDRVVARQQEQEYQRHLEEKFRDESEAMNVKVIYWSIFQLVVVLGSSAFQIYRLRSFFKTKKLH